MRILFLGTPDYAVPSLVKLHALAPKHEVVGVVSQPDKPKGRSKEPSPPPVVEAARKLGIPNECIFQPRSINKTAVLDPLRALAPDVLCVVAYGGLLKKDALALARLYPINAHGSLLPKYRGASPIQAALLAGDAESGVCIMKMELGLDTGPVMLRRAIPIAPTDDAGTLHDKLAALSADCFVEGIEQIAAGPVTFEPQDEAKASLTKKLEKNSGTIDWKRSAVELERFVRAMNPWPGAWTSVALPDGSQKVRVRVCHANLWGAGVPPASVSGAANAESDSFTVACGNGALVITQIQPEGKRPMSVAEFLRGAGRKFVPASMWL
jgi:methionyl-tRNA formyltransferase